jgi:hypothetical protein
MARALHVSLSFPFLVFFFFPPVVKLNMGIILSMFFVVLFCIRIGNSNAYG